MKPKMEIKVGEKYRNVHTGRVCLVTNKVFFNVAYRQDGEPNSGVPHYCHYKRFKKNWVEATAKCTSRGETETVEVHEHTYEITHTCMECGKTRTVHEKRIGGSHIGGGED